MSDTAKVAAIQRVTALRYKDDSVATLGEGSVDAGAAERLQAARRKNLTHALRLRAELSPILTGAVDSVRSKLAPHLKVEAYVYNAPEAQAFGYHGITGETIVIGLTSGIVRLVTPSELRFVIGHELGHCLMGHGAYPEVETMNGEVERLNLLALKRAAEISADRVGFVACDSREDAFRAILKVISGLPADLIRFDVTAYLDQGKDLCQMGGSEYELLSTHPMFTARLRSLLWFEMSDLYFDWAGRSGNAPIDNLTLHKRVRGELAAASGFRLARINEEAVRSALLWGVLGIFVVDNTLSKAEQELLRRTFGDIAADNAIQFVKDSGPAAVAGKFDEKLRGVYMMSHDTREALYEDLERFASMAGGSEHVRRAWLQVVIDRLGLVRTVNINQTGTDSTFALKSGPIFHEGRQRPQ